MLSGFCMGLHSSMWSAASVSSGARTILPEVFMDSEACESIWHGSVRIVAEVCRRLPESYYFFCLSRHMQQMGR
jgi:hypothetical protein